MRKIYLAIPILTILLTFTCCRHRGVSLTPIENESDPHDSIFLKVFKSSVLQDSLESFILATDSMPTPYGPPVYSITCRKEYRRIYVTIGADGTIMMSVNPVDGSSAKPVGATIIKGKVISVDYTGDTSALSVMDSSFLRMLDSSLYVKYEYLDMVSHCCNETPSIRQYHVVDMDSIELVYIRKSKHELELQRSRRPL